MNILKINDKRKNGKSLGKLEGVPIGVTEEISIKGVLTSAGSKMLENYIPPFNATIIDKLLEEGAVILEGLEIGEFGLTYSESSATSVKNSEALCTLSFDGSGIPRQSASRNGVFAIKPSTGLISRYGVIAPTSSLGQIAVTGKKVEDLATVLSIIVGYDKRDSVSIAREDILSESIPNTELNNRRIGLPKELFGEEVAQEVREMVLQAAKELEKLGNVIEEVSIPSLDYVIPSYHVISSAEFSSNAARYDGISYGYRAKEYENLEELYKKSRSESFGDEAKKRIMFGNFVLSSEQYDEYFRKAQQVRTLIKDEFDKAFKKYDLILSPVSPSVGAYKEEKHTIVANMAGLPAISIPCGLDQKGNNIGFQLIGPIFSEDNLLNLAYSYVGGGE